MKSLSKELFKLIETRYGHADLMWTRSIPIPGDDDFPVLQLPTDQLRYATDRGYPVTFAPRSFDGKPLLIVQLESFAIATHKDADWAIPGAYTPTTDDQRISQALGFDEGWEDAQFECAFVCDDKFATFWRAAFQRKRFGLTAPEAMSLYPVALGERELEPLGEILSKWHKLPS